MLVCLLLYTPAEILREWWAGRADLFRTYGQHMFPILSSPHQQSGGKKKKKIEATPLFQLPILLFPFFKCMRLLYIVTLEAKLVWELEWNIGTVATALHFFP